eukprot:362606-Chlamydomonas_euryale.AAC.10
MRVCTCEHEQSRHAEQRARSVAAQRAPRARQSPRLPNPVLSPQHSESHALRTARSPAARPSSSPGAAPHLLLHQQQRLAHRIPHRYHASVVVAALAKPAPVVANQVEIEVVRCGRRLAALRGGHTRHMRTCHSLRNRRQLQPRAC